MLRSEMFRFLHQERLIGRSALEDGDPPMGCAEGVFLAEDGFLEFQSRIAPQSDDDPTITRWVGLTVRTEDGVDVECMDAVLIKYDFGDHTELRIDVLGIPYPRYEELFPGRYADYDASFGKDQS